MNARPDIFKHIDKGPAVSRARQLEITHLVVNYAGGGGLFSRAKPFQALKDITLSLGRGECLGVVGESGSGKSTLGRAVLQMIGYEGSITLDGKDFSKLSRPAKRAERRRIQVVFQDPRESLNPRMKIKDIVAEPIRLAGGTPTPTQIAGLLNRVGLNPEIGERLPGNVSGGQAQRIAIARALGGGTRDHRAG